MCEARRVVVFHLGHLGDAVVAAPAMWAVRHRFPKAHITLLSSRSANSNFVPGHTVFDGAELFDDFIQFYSDLSAGIGIKKLRRFVHVLLTLRLGRYDTLVYLAPSKRTPRQIHRDRMYFRAGGVRHMLGMDYVPPVQARRTGELLPTLPSEAEQMLQRLRSSGIDAPPLADARKDLGINEREYRAVETWLAKQPADGGRPWIAIGPGSKMPAKIWPEKRFAELIARLIDRFDVWPVVFGDDKDRLVGQRVLQEWKRGYNAAGIFTPRESAAALARCRLYVGNDTGTMHLAASADVHCVAIFSARDYPGLWEPVGAGHSIIRKTIDCEGCMLVQCIERQMECITRISVDEVYDVCCRVLEQELSRENTAKDRVLEL